MPAENISLPSLHAWIQNGKLENAELKTMAG